MNARGPRVKALLGALSLLVVGGVLGAGLERHVLASAEHGAPASVHEAAMASLQERLDLRPEQRRQIDSIMAAHHDVLQQTWQVLHAQLAAAVDTVHRDVEAVLTPVQREEFRVWLREIRGDQ